MPRKSPCHYIAPSAISITPNANDSANDLAVYIARGTKIKVHSRTIESLGMVDSTFQEWSLTGRNRRLKADIENTKPYTIYARLRKVPDGASEEEAAKAHADGYLIFVPKKLLGHKKTTLEEVWVDEYSSVTDDGLSVLYTVDGEEVRIEYGNTKYWLIRLGDVSKRANGLRTVTLDTGILGTDQFNMEWQLDPDALPLRVELNCEIDKKNVGQTPYVAWGKVAELKAKLVEGWETDAKNLVDHWTISRNTGNAEADDRWNYPYGGDSSDSSDSSSSSSEEEALQRIMAGGQINLSHLRGGTDDFAGAFAATFTVTAWGKKLTEDVPETNDLVEHSISSDSDSSDSSSSSSEEKDVVKLADAMMTFLAETVEKFELAPSVTVVSYSPQSNSYNPAAGVTIHVRAINQGGDAFDISREQLHSIGLDVEYTTVNSDNWKRLSFGSEAIATAVIPTSAFAAQQSLNVRLVRILDSGDSSDSDSSDSDSSSSGAGSAFVELDRKTIAFIRDGEDSREREWIYFRSKTAITFGDADSDHPRPSAITTGEVSPAGAAGSGTPYDDTLNKWVPMGWYDHAQGVDEEYPYEYGSYREFTHKPDSDSSDSDSSSSSSDEPSKGHWGPFTDPAIWSHYGQRGTDGDGVEYVFIRTTKNVAPVLSHSTAEDSRGRSATDAEYLPLISNATACGAETNGKAGECTDDPKGCTRELPYEWVAKRTMDSPDETGRRVWKTYYNSVGTPYKMSLWGNHAENAIRLDLSNEMDMVQTDSTGKVTAARTVTTVVTVFDGAKISEEAELNDNVNTLAIGTKANGTANKPTITTNANGTWTITWTFAVGDMVNPTNPVDIDVLFFNVPYTESFMLAASMGQPIYQLQPTLNSINFTRKVSDNTLDPASRTLGLKILKIDGGSTVGLGSCPTGYTVRWAYDTMPTSASGTVWSSGDIATIQSNTSNTNVCIVLFYGTVIIDRETIPILKDGEHGDGIVSITTTYQISASGEPGSGRQYPADITSWVATSPAVTEAKPYLWVKEEVTYKYADANTKYYCVGAKGDNGIDAQDVEWVYVRTTKKTAPTIVAGSGTDYWKQDDFKPQAKVSTGRIKGNGGTEADANVAVQCTDDPQGVDETWMYEWEMKRTKGEPTKGRREWNNYTPGAAMTLRNNYADGASPWIADLDNEMDSVSCDDTGYPVAEQTVETTVALYHGITQESFTIDTATGMKRNGTAMIWNNSTKKWTATGIEVTFNSSNGKVSVKYVTAAKISGKDVYTITLKNTDNSITRELKFTVNGINGDVYNLLPSVKDIVAQRTASGGYVINGSSVFTIVCGYTKTTNGNTSTPSTSVTDGVVDGKYYMFYSLRERESQKWQYWQEGTGVNFNDVGTPFYERLKSGTSSFNINTYDAVKIVLTPKGSDHDDGYAPDDMGAIDVETLYVIAEGKEGAAGKNSIRIDLDNQADLIACDADGKVRFARTVVVNARIYDGATPASSGVTNSTTDSLVIGGCTPTTSLNSGILTITWAFTKGMAVPPGTYQKTIRLTYGGQTYEAKFTISTTNDVCIYQLVPSHNAVPFVRNSSNVLTPSAIQVSCGYVKITGDGTTSFSGEEAYEQCRYTESGVQKYRMIDGKYFIFRRFINSDGTATGWTFMCTRNVYYDEIPYNTPYTAIEYAMSTIGDYAVNVNDSNIIDRETVPITKDGTDGTSPWIADLDNEMDGVSCDQTGYVAAQQSVTTKVSLYHGTEAQTIDSVTVKRNGTLMTNNTEANGVKYSLSGNTITITYYAKETAQTTAAKISNGKDLFTITLTNRTNSITRELVFTVKAVTGDVYNVLPKDQEIIAKKDANGNYTVNGSNIYSLVCGYTRRANGVVVETVEDCASGVVVSGDYQIFYRLRSRITGYWSTWHDGTSYYDGAGLPMFYGLRPDNQGNPPTINLNYVDAVWFFILYGLTDDRTGYAPATPPVVDSEVVYVIGEGVTQTVRIGDNGNWIINGVDTGVKAEGTDGTGVEIKGTVKNSSKMTISNGKGYVIPMKADGTDDTQREAANGDSYVCDADRHLYMFTTSPLKWNDLGEFKGEPGKSSYMHIAYATGITFSGGSVSAVTGFTVINQGVNYDWWGFCTDNNDTEPGQGASSTDVTAARKYKWNYMRGKDGDGTEYVYLLTKEGFTPTINQTTGQGSPSADEFLPAVANYDGNQSKIYPGTGSGVVYWDDDPPASVSASWPILWWAKRNKKYNAGTGQTTWGNFGTVTLHNRWSKDGQNSVRLALDNQHEDFLYNDAGTLIAPAGGATSQIHIYDGGTDVDLSNAALSIDYSTGKTTGVPDSGDTGAPTISNGILTVPALTAASAKVVVKAHYPNTQAGKDYYAEFTANKTNQDKYDLEVTPNAIAYNPATYPSASGTGTSISLGAKMTDLGGNVTTLAFGSYSSKTKISSTSGKGYLRLFIGIYQGVSPSVYDVVMTQQTSTPFIADKGQVSNQEYLHIELRKYSTTTGSSYTVVDYEDIEIAKVENGAPGQNAVVCDTDNDMAMIAVNSAGKVCVPNQTVVIKAHILDGATVVKTGVTRMTSVDSLHIPFTDGTSVGPQANPGSGVDSTTGWVTFTWTIPTGKILSNMRNTFPLKLKYNNVEYESSFTIIGFNSDAVYQLAPSMSEMVFSVDSNNEYTPSPQRIDCGYTKFDGTDTQTFPGSVKANTCKSNQGGTAPYNIFYRLMDDGGNYTTWAWMKDTPDTGSGTRYIEIGAGDGYAAVEFAMSTADSDTGVADSNIIDRETVPIVKSGKDGAPGQNAIRLALDNEHEDFLYSAAGLVAPSGGATSQAHLYDGPEDETSNVGQWRISDNNGSSWGTSTSTNATASINTTTGLLTVSGLVGNSAKIKVRALYNGEYYYADFTANKTNQDKYDIIVKPNAIAYNTSEAWTDKTITISAEGMNAQGGKLTPSITTSGSYAAGQLRVFWGYVKSNGKIYKPSATTTEGTEDLLATSKTLTQSEAGNYIGIYFELRYYTSASAYRLCDYETVEISAVSRGGKGDDAVIYELKVSKESATFPLGSTSMTVPLSAWFYKREGNNATETYSAYWAAYARTGDSYRFVYRSSSKVTSFTDTSHLSVNSGEEALVVYFGNSQFSNSNSAPSSTAYLAKKEVLLKYPPALIRGPRKWDDVKNEQLFRGSPGEPYMDLVTYNNGLYQCIQTHGPNSPKTPTNTSYWTAATQYDFIATNLLYSLWAEIENLQTKRLRVTGDDSKTIVEISPERPFEITYNGQTCLVIAVDNGNAYLDIYENGSKVGRIDSNLFSTSGVSNSWAELRYKYFASKPSWSDVSNIQTSDTQTYYKFSEGYVMQGSVRKYNISQGSQPDSRYNNRVFSQKTSGNHPPILSDRITGWYVNANNGIHMQKIDGTYVERAYYYEDGALDHTEEIEST